MSEFNTLGKIFDYGIENIKIDFRIKALKAKGDTK
jgi:hypothetical protein